jgi:serine/threonine-protein kinase RsbW
VQAHERGEGVDPESLAGAGGFSAATMRELLRALQARALEHPESPALIASWPGVSAEQMPAACAELRRQGHDVHEVSIPRKGGTARRGYSVDAQVLPEPEAPGTVFLRELAEPAAVRVARAAVTRWAQREGASDAVRTSLALAVTEACANVVVHAYADAEVPGHFEVRAMREDGVLIVEVRDDGRGMKPRVDSPGLGFGLPLITQTADRLEVTGRGDQPGVIVRMEFNLEVPDVRRNSSQPASR